MVLIQRLRKKPTHKKSKTSKYRNKSSTNRNKKLKFFGLFKKIKTRKVRKLKGGWGSSKERVDSTLQLGGWYNAWLLSAAFYNNTYMTVKIQTLQHIWARSKSI